MTKSESFRGSGETVNSPPEPDTMSTPGDLTFPDLTPSKYEPVTKLLTEIDVHGRQLLHVFFEKSFSGYFELSKQFPQAFLDVTQEVNSSILQVIYEDRPRKASSLLTIKKRFFGGIEKLVDQYRSLIESDSMRTGISWYIHRLQKDLAAFPGTVPVEYDREEFRIKSEDSPALKWLKMRRNLAASLSKGPIRADLHYRDAMSYYMRDGRYEFLVSWLEACRKNSLQSLAGIESYIGLCDEKFNDLFEFTQSGTLTVAQWEESTREMASKANEIIDRQQRASELFKDRLLVEFRLNIDHLRNHLEQIDANHLTRVINADKKYHRSLRENILSFAGNWHKAMLLGSGRISLDVALRSFKWQVEHELKDFRRQIDNCISTTMLDPLEQIFSQLENWQDGRKDMGSLRKLEWKPAKETIANDFKALSERLSQFTKGLPVKATIPAPSSPSDDPDETGERVIPVRRLCQHFLEHNFLSPLYKEIDDLIEKLKDIVFNSNDHLSFALFTIKNAGTEGHSDASASGLVISNALKEIRVDEPAIREKKHELTARVHTLAEELFGSLTVDAMIHGADDFAHISRDAQKGKVLSRLGAWSVAVKRFFIEKFLILIYSRSEGIRIARQIAARGEGGSITEQTLEVVNKVTPDQQIISALPHFYLNLFSGRSSISEDFWVRQDTEEKQIARAVEHYLEGHYGGILVVGERNSGKTALCRRIAEKYFKDNKVFHLFASGDGSCNPRDFIGMLSDVTGVPGDLPGIMNSLPHHSVIVIHDLELWWERTAEGLAVVQNILEMMATYADRAVFIVNMNPFACNLIHAVTELRERFIGVVRRIPLTSLELKNLILTRHRSSGLDFALDNGKSDISEIATARMFNYYFNYADGNPGVAMNAWLNSIVRVDGNRLIIKPPGLPDTEVLEQLPAEWNVILIQLILHKRMSLEKLRRVFGNEYSGLEMSLNALLRAGLIEKRPAALYALNPYVEPFVIRAFKLKDWL